FILDDQVWWSQRTLRERACLWEASHGSVLIFILQVRCVKAVAAAPLVHLPKQHLCGPIPGHLREFIDGGNQQRRQAAVNFFIDDQHWQTLGSVAATEGAATQGIAAVEKRAPTPLGER